MNKNILITTLSLSLSALFMSSNAIAVEGLSANVGVTSNYLWRDLEQTNGDPAVFGGIDYETSSGFYVGTWVSNASWSPGMTYELDVYGGYTNEINDFSYDIGFVHYAYPDANDNVDFTEVNASASWKIFTLSYAVLADAKGANFGDDSYISASTSFEIVPELELSMHIATGTDAFYAGESFVSYGASLSKNNFTFGLSKTNLSHSDIKAFISYSVDIDL